MAAVQLSEYIILFVLVVIKGAGVPGPGDASLIGAGTPAGELALAHREASTTSS